MYSLSRFSDWTFSSLRDVSYAGLHVPRIVRELERIVHELRAVLENGPKMKALLISYHFPPSLGGCPMRTGAFADSLVERGWECHVIAAKITADHPIYKLDREAEGNTNERRKLYLVSEGFLGWTARQFRRHQDANSNGHTGNGKSQSLFSQAASIIKPLAFPDPKAGWIPGAIRQARQLMRKHDFDLIYSFGYPWSCHIVASRICGGSGIPWIADYGDPWTFSPVGRDNPSWRKKLDFLVESALLKKTAAVVVTTPETRDGFLSVFGAALKRPIYVSPVAQFHDAEYEAVPGQLPGHFQISFTGMYDSTRSPYPFYDAAKLFCGQGDVRICVAGLIGKSYVDYAETAGLGSLVSHRARLNRRETVQLQRSSHVLLSFGWPGGLQVPCKVYEYFAARRPILHIAGDAQDPAARLVQQFRRGLVVPNEVGAIRTALQTFHELWQQGKLEEAFDLSPIKQFCLPQSLHGLWHAVDHVLPKAAAPVV
jgi:hypothetical protein